MKKIILVSLLLSVFVGCGHMYKGSGCGSSCGGCKAGSPCKTETKSDKECEDCKKGS